MNEELKKQLIGFLERVSQLGVECACCGVNCDSIDKSYPKCPIEEAIEILKKLEENS